MIRSHVLYPAELWAQYFGLSLRRFSSERLGGNDIFKGEGKPLVLERMHRRKEGKEPAGEELFSILRDRDADRRILQLVADRSEGRPLNDQVGKELFDFHFN